MAAARNWGVKTPAGDKMVWWKEKANKAFWQKKYASQINNDYKMVAEGKTRDPCSLLKAHLPREGIILEAGCGTGWVVATLCRDGFNVEGVDSSPHLVRDVKEQWPALPVRVADVCDLQVPDATYSGYISLGVIEHRQEGPGPFLQEAYRVLSPGGTACISVPFYNPLRRCKMALAGQEDTRGEDLDFYQYGFSKSYFRKALIRAGFEVSAFRYYGTIRGLQEEATHLYGNACSVRGLGRLARRMDALDWTGLMAHMILAVATKPT